MTWLWWTLALTFGLLIVVGVVISMDEMDRRHRRLYLGMCVYCGEPRHTGRKCG